MSNIITLKNSTITGIHKTKVGAHQFVAMNVERDDEIQHIDPQCMKVIFPSHVAQALLHEVTYPKNSEHRRYKDQLVEDCLGKKVGNVPANICGFFRKLLQDGLVKNIKW